jgi:hypothetical protein
MGRWMWFSFYRVPTQLMLRLASALILLPVSLGFAAAAPASTSIDFNRDIQPILSENCFHCHGPDRAQRKGDLRLDEEKDAKADHGGTTAIVPGKSADSELIRRIFSDDPDDVMPTPKSNRKLTTQQKELLKRWIDEGAKWGEHWAFVAPVKPAVPQIANRKSQITNPIDAFVLAKLEQEKLAPSPTAPKETLIRRVTLDLTGLPPTPEEIDAFLQDASPQAYERVVDRLLKSPRYGERMAWDWLDSARYSDTNGFQGDPERTMWPWRDWVVRTFNANMPYNQFTVEQLAGDLLANATHEQKLASGFHRNNMHNGEGGRIAEETRVENVFDRVETTATIWLGLTFTCCRCHDHKFDPLSSQDYYGLYDIFNQMSETGAGRGGQAPPVIDMSTPAEEAKVKAANERLTTAAEELEKFELTKFPRPAGAPLTESDAIKLPGNLPQYIGRTEPKKRGVDPLLEAVGYFKERDPAYTKLLEKLLAAVRSRDAAVNGITKVMIMDQLEKQRDTFILSKGAYDKPTTEKVTGMMPVKLVSQPQDAAKRANRLDLAHWLVAKDNPLTARVTVNRYWQMLFGTGLVKTVEDFGVQGEKPSHPELLDWLSIRFVESGWDLKALIKLMVMSSTYCQSSRVTPALQERDPENRLLARGPRYRLPSWMLRDDALAAAGLLVDTPGGPSVKPYQPEGIWEEATFGKKTYKQDHETALYRRSLYIFWRRIVGPTMIFDNAARQVCTVKSFRTNTPLHALTTLNDITYVEAARALAQRVMLAQREDAARLDLAFKLVMARSATPDERGLLLQRLEYLKTEFTEDPGAAPKLLAVGESKRDEKIEANEHAAWTALCQLILNLDEALTKE